MRLYNAENDEHERQRIKNAIARCRIIIERCKNTPEPVLPEGLVCDGKNGDKYQSPTFGIKRAYIMISILEERLKELG